jgi:hypothetical protein
LNSALFQSGSKPVACYGTVDNKLLVHSTEPDIVDKIVKEANGIHQVMISGSKISADLAVYKGLNILLLSVVNLRSSYKTSQILRIGKSSET